MSSYRDKIKEIHGKDLENFVLINDAITDGIVPGVWATVDELRDWLIDLIIERNRMREEIDIFCDGCSTSWEELIEGARDEGY